MTTTTTDLAEIDIDEIEAELADSPEVWEAVRESAEEILAGDPEDADALRNLAEYHEWERTYLVPKKHKGVWSKCGATYLIKTSKKAQSGDTCTVRERNGAQKVFVLDDKHGDGLWLGHRIDRDWEAA
jgi:hypothetical protein